MKSAAAVAVAMVGILGLPGCGGDKPAGGGATTPSGAPALASLDARSAQPEQWTLEEGGPTGFLYFANPQLKLSDGCRKPDGSLDCEAFRFLKSGTPIDLARRSLDGRRSAGVLACMKLGNQLVHGRNAMGSEDGFCRFRDGSFTTTGALETYSVRVIE